MQNSDAKRSSSAELDNLAQQTAELFLQAFGNHPGFRLTHAKGLVCGGTFEPAKGATELSRAAHFKGGTVPVIVRFSNSTGVPQIPDGDPNSNPKGMAIQFKLPDGKITDIVANSQNGFPAGTPADFVGFVGAIVATKPDSPKPTPMEKFLGTHQATAAFLSRPNPQTASFASLSYFGNNAFIFVNGRGEKQATRYQIIPVAGEQQLAADMSAAKPPDFLFDELKERIRHAPVAFRLMVQVASPDDSTSDATQVWPENRRKVELGIIRIASIDPKSAESEKALTFDPTHLTDGIEFSDDPLPEFRAKVYSISIARRQSAR